MTTNRDRNTTEGRKEWFMDVDRMVNEGLGGGQVSEQSGLIGETTADTMDDAESVRAEGIADPANGQHVNKPRADDRHVKKRRADDQ